MNEIMINQLNIKEIDEIISFLQEPYPYELIKRLEDLKKETIFYIKFHNQKMIDRMNEEKQILEHGLGSAPVRSAYFKLVPPIPSAEGC